MKIFRGTFNNEKPSPRFPWQVAAVFLILQPRSRQMVHVRADSKSRLVVCTDCGLPTVEARRGMCPACDRADRDKRDRIPVCECCGHGDLRALVRRQLDGSQSFILCANCDRIAGQRSITVSALKDEVFPEGDRRSGDRRLGLDRRWGSRREHRRRLLARETNADRRRRVERRSS